MDDGWLDRRMMNLRTMDGWMEWSNWMAVHFPQYSAL